MEGGSKGAREGSREKRRDGGREKGRDIILAYSGSKK